MELKVWDWNVQQMSGVEEFLFEEFVGWNVLQLIYSLDFIWNWNFCQYCLIFYSICLFNVYWWHIWNYWWKIIQKTKSSYERIPGRDSVQGVKSLGGHFACLCRGFEFYEVKKNVFIFQKENGNTFTLFIIFLVKSLQKEQKSPNLLLWPPISRNKHAIT